MSTTKTKPIHDLVHMNADHYEEHYTEIYMRWCIAHSINMDTDLQKILANSSINKWYNLEFGKLEKIFIEMAAPMHGKIKYTQARITYNTIITEIFMKFPMPLIAQARNLNINAN